MSPYVPPPNYSVVQQALIPPKVQAEYAIQRTAEQRTAIELRLGEAAMRAAVMGTNQRF